ncbi:uncharacterized protein RCO7_04967 [Rhynchosporium graminicola]|uniref:AGC-kinase C-terminal domain-containing protein n=1 Tax=Rhynchosporium graminicola TaxID=2792576 RepID=A0A1E1KDZ7_9HELO|nr:uncharacterized protein RCO7_04967 [Rhynchosporium commune]
MFAKLLPHHRRISSNPTSPADQPLEPPPSHADHAHPARHHDANFQESTNRSPPLSLQPLAHMKSPEGTFVSPRRSVFGGDPRAQKVDAAMDTRGRDTYGFSVQGRLPYAGSQQPDSAGNSSAGSYTSPQYLRSQSGMNLETSRSRPQETSPSFVTSPELLGQNGQHTKKLSSSFSSSTPNLVEPTQPRPGRARLNLLNPMSLLARRRTSQAVEKLAPQSLVSNRTGKIFNETFDPRIRGTVVHDFSAPRAPPKSNLSGSDVRTEGISAKNLKYQRSPNRDSADESVISPWSGGNHTPVFTEDFEEEQYPNAGPHVRKASDVTDLPLPQPPYAKGMQKSAEPNSTSKGNDGAQKQDQDSGRISSRKPIPDIPRMPDHPPPVPPKSDVPVHVATQRISIDASATPPKAASFKKGRSRNVSDVSAKDAAIPKHMKSTSSRFSFDMIGAAKQERLLEDRHRQKALEKEAEQNEEGSEDNRFEDEFDNDYDYNDMDDDDGLEERIPGVNTDLDGDDYLDEDLEERIPGFDEEEEPYQLEDPDETLGAFKFQQASLAIPLSPTSPGMVSTPRDAAGEVIGFAMTKDSPWGPQGLDANILPTSPIAPDVPHAAEMQGLGIQLADKSQHVSSGSMASNLSENTASQHLVSMTSNLPLNTVEEFPRPAALDDDDLYFDDGMIGSPDEADVVEFDESIFDHIDTDQYGRPLKSLSSLPTLCSPPMLTADPSPSFNKASDGSRMSTDLTDVTVSSNLPNGGLAPQPSMSGQRQTSMGPPPIPQQGLTIDKLAAYQQALAAAAFTAAANGKFRRDSINPSDQGEDIQPGLVADSSHTSHYEPFSPAYDAPEDDFDYDDVLQDDDIIACANAEALANDDDGFYGQEFGFYSAHANNETEFGGYFGPRGSSGIARGPSNRVVSREPNLTPITERSEYSNRNSFMSLALHGSNNVVSPGLAQLTNMLRSPMDYGSPMDYDGDMSYDSLLKLRRGAWGGSQASLHSSNGGSPKSAANMDDGSPVGGVPPWANGGAINVPLGNQNQNHGYAQQASGPSHRRRNSAFSLQSEGASAASSPPASPTLTMSFPPLDGIQERPRDEDGCDHEHNHERQQAERKEDLVKEGGKKHRYKNSAESISYTKDEDSSGSPRWILERRRTGEDGEVECERELVRGGI